MYGEICRIIAQDKELRQLFLRLRTPSCWPDKASHIMTADFCRYVSRRYAQPSAEGLGEREDKIQIGPEGASVTEQDSALCCPYTKGDFIKDVYLDSRRTDALLSLLRHKKNVILQGPPGVGKTYAARRLAYTLMGERMTAASNLSISMKTIVTRTFSSAINPSLQDILCNTVCSIVLSACSSPSGQGVFSLLTTSTEAISVRFSVKPSCLLNSHIAMCPSPLPVTACPLPYRITYISWHDEYSRQGNR